MADYRITIGYADGQEETVLSKAMDVVDNVNAIAKIIGGMTVGASMSYVSPLTWTFVTDAGRITIRAEEIKAAVQQ